MTPIQPTSAQPPKPTQLPFALNALCSVIYLIGLAFRFGAWSTKSLTSYLWKKQLTHDQKLLDIQRQWNLRGCGQIAQGGKSTSTLFRPRSQGTTKIDMSTLNQVLSIDKEKKIAHVEGMATFYDIVKATLPLGLVPKVVPELRSITAGGAISGLAVESSSFKYGLVHRTVTEMEILTGTGAVVTATKDNEYSDLFSAMPNSYGTLGYILSAKIELVPCKPYVHLNYHHYEKAEALFEGIKFFTKNEKDFDFIDGVIYSPTSATLIVGMYTDNCDKPGNYVEKSIYYKTIREKKEDVVTTHDYLWRWDADLFWSTRGTLLQHPGLRALFGRTLLRSDRLKRINQFVKEFYANMIAPYKKKSSEPREEIIQDVGIPLKQCASFYNWFQEEIGIHPIFICPLRSAPKSEHTPLWQLAPDEIYCDIGFFGSKKTPYNPAEGHFNKRVEEQVELHNGKKSLYSRSYFPQEKFEELYGGTDYNALKKRYDPDRRFPTLFQKCVMNQ